MNTTDTATQATIEPTRREVLAFIALAEAPAPHTISLDRYDYEGEEARPALTLRLRSSVDLFVWLPLFKVEMRAVVHGEASEDGTRYHYSGQWRGRHVILTACDPIPAPVVESLDEATRTALAGVR